MRGVGVQLEFASLRAAPPNLYNSPPHANFIETLAAAVHEGSFWNRGKPQPHDLPGLSIYLPAHATVQPLKLALLSQSPNGATFLPRIRVLGDIDPLELFAAFGPRIASTEQALDLLKKALAVPQAFDDLDRRVQLSALVIGASRTMRSTRLAPPEELFANVPAVSAYTIAGQIAALMDEAYDEGADLSRIEKLESAGAPGSEQLALHLLRAIWKRWLDHKAKTGKLDREERRNRLMAIEAEFVRHSDAPVIVAGSTGSVSATVGLMAAVLGRPRSAIMLHGLDRHLDDESWAAVANHPEHAQHGLHHLLSRLGVRREDVQDVAPYSPPPLREMAGERKGPETSEIQTQALRRCNFLSEALRPASTAEKWADYIEAQKNETANTTPSFCLLEAETLQEEAMAIALILRKSLEKKGQSAAFVTPDDRLINRVRHALSQWGLPLGTCADLHGEDLIALSIASCTASGKPEEFVSLLKSGRGKDSETIHAFAEIIDLGVLRQMWRPSSFSSIPAALARSEHAISAGEARHSAMKRVAPMDWNAAREFSAGAIEALAPLTSRAGQTASLTVWVSAHLQALEHLARLGLRGFGHDEKQSSTLRELSRLPLPALTLDLGDYAGFISGIIKAKSRGRADSPHPRIALITPLDARLLTADVIVLGGLNEGCWPHAPVPDPWLSRRDRDFVGLSSPERRIGQAAQDFAAMAASAANITLTRSRKVNGSLTRPSRWISRIKALAAGTGQLLSIEREKPWLGWTRAVGSPDKVTPVLRPEPRPPLTARPRRLSVTAIETWLANPYAIYARHILQLEPLRELDAGSDARDKGILYHAALHRFFQAYPDRVPHDAAERLTRELDSAAIDLGFNLENAPFWRPRFARFASWFTETEEARREGLRLLKSEAGGKLKLDAPLGPFEITARADRIDILRNGRVQIYDFKTSANTAKISAARGAPQLALEGFLAQQGAFAGIPVGSAADLAYIVATGGEPPGEIVTLKSSSAGAIEAAHSGTLAQIERFDRIATPYAYKARAIYADRADYDPYAHLARTKEWASQAFEEEAGDD